MSDRRFIVLLISACTALLGAGVVVLAVLDLQDPVYRDFDTRVVRDTSRTLIGLVTVGAVLIVAGVGTVVTLSSTAAAQPSLTHQRAGDTNLAGPVRPAL